MQIRLHKLLYQIHFLEALQVGWAEDIEDGDDVLVVKVAEELDLAKGAEAEHGVVEGGYALYGDAALGWNVCC
jgi:hypothetical protein